MEMLISAIGLSVRFIQPDLQFPEADITVDLLLDSHASPGTLRARNHRVSEASLRWLFRDNHAVRRTSVYLRADVSRSPVRTPHDALENQFIDEGRTFSAVG